MTSLTPCKTVWVIQKADTEEWLGSRDRNTATGVSFGARVPFYYPSFRAAKRAWASHCLAEKYIVKGVSLPHEEQNLKPGPNLCIMPDVLFIELALTEVQKRGLRDPDI